MSKGDHLHTWTAWQPAYAEEIEIPEFVLDNVLTAGTVVIAGERGLGKTSAIVPMMLSVAGLCRDFPMKASILRKVIYVSEDPGQVRRIIRAMVENGDVAATPAEINDAFKLVQATRLPVDDIVAIKAHIEDYWCNNEKMDGGNYCAPPVIVLDTTNATIELDNISDNSEVSRAVSGLRNGFGQIPLVLIGHVAKATRSDARQMSFVGAGAWEGDTQQNLYLVMEDNIRYLIIGKNRFSPEVREYVMHSRVADLNGINKLGQLSDLRCFYSIPEPTSAERKAELKAEREADIKIASFFKLQIELLDKIRKSPGINTGSLKAHVTGKSERIGYALNQLEEDGKVRVETRSNRSRLYYPVDVC